MVAGQGGDDVDTGQDGVVLVHVDHGGLPDVQKLQVFLVKGDGDAPEHGFLIQGAVFLQPNAQLDGAVHAGLLVNALVRQALPVLEDAAQGLVHLGQKGGHGGAGPEDGFYLSAQLVTDGPPVVAGVDQALFLVAPAAGAAGDLLDLAGVELPLAHAVKFLVFQEDDAFDREVHAHTDGVGGHDDAGLSGGKLPGFGLPGLVGQGAVNDGDLAAGVFQYGRGLKDAAAGEDHQGVAGAHVVGEDEGGVFHFQGCGPVMADDLPGIAAFLDELDDQAFGFRRHAGVDGAGGHAQHRLGPGPAPLAVGNHLAFVNDGHVVPFAFGEHFDGAGGVFGARDPLFLFPGDHVAGDAVAVHAFGHFHGQQAQGGQVDAPGGAFAGYHGVVGLAGIGGADVEDEVASHAAGHGVQVRDAVGNPFQHGLTGQLVVPGEGVEGVFFHAGQDAFGGEVGINAVFLGIFPDADEPLADPVVDVHPMALAGDVFIHPGQIRVFLEEQPPQSPASQVQAAQVKIGQGRPVGPFAGPAAQLEFEAAGDFFLAAPAALDVQALVLQPVLVQGDAHVGGFLPGRPGDLIHGFQDFFILIGFKIIAASGFAGVVAPAIPVTAFPFFLLFRTFGIVHWPSPLFLPFLP